MSSAARDSKGGSDGRSGSSRVGGVACGRAMPCSPRAIRLGSRNDLGYPGGDHGRQGGRCRAPRLPRKTARPASPMRRSPHVEGQFNLSGLRPGHLRDYRRDAAVQAADQDRSGPGRPDGDGELQDRRPTCFTREAVEVVGNFTDGRNAHLGDRHQRHRGADAVPAAEPAQLPELRRARARRARVRQRDSASR